MRNTSWLALTAILVLPVMVAADEEKIALDKVPAKIIAALKEKFPDAEFLNAAKEDEEGQLIYEINLNHQGQNYSIESKPDGTIVTIEKEIAVKELPEVVGKTLKDRFSRATVKKAEEVTKGDKISYEVAIAMDRNGKPMRAKVTFDSTGKVVNWENPDTKLALSALPKKVVEDIKERFPGAKLVKAEKEMADGQLVYEVVIQHKGEQIETEFSAEGEFLLTEVTIKKEDLPKAALETLEAKYPGVKYRHFEKVTKKDGTVNYEVIIQTADKRSGEVVFDSQGKFLKAEGLEKNDEKKDKEK
jgi:uncharacterized membrane protein YkoI